jgi:undecaprenyl-diphosphatase
MAPRKSPTGPWWLKPFKGLTRLERHELNWLIVGLAACTLLFVFVKLAGAVGEGNTASFDAKILRALRSPDDPGRPLGPPWMLSVLLDVTAVGSSTVLWLVVLAVLGFLLLQTRFKVALFVFLTCVSGEFLNYAMKRSFNRPRPSVVPHLRDVFSTSFPSGHAMESAIVYLTLGAILMSVAVTRLTKLYIFVVALMLPMIVGISRIYLGVHYPTDVIGGWIIGFVWASVCWLAAHRFEAFAGLDEKRT